MRAPSGIVSADSVAPPLSCPLMRASTRTIGRSLVTTATRPQTRSVQPLADMALEDVNRNSSILNGYELNVTVMDSASDKFRAYAASDALVSQGVVAIIGAVIFA